MSTFFFDEKSQIPNKIYSIFQILEKAENFDWNPRFIIEKKMLASKFLNFHKTYLICKIITKYEGKTPKTLRDMLNLEKLFFVQKKPIGKGLYIPL